MPREHCPVLPRRAGAAMLVAALALAACGSAPHAPSAAHAAAAAALASERNWLQSWFKGTPVRIEMATGEVLAIDVPREYCFDTGRSSVKPALRAVLDKVAESLRRQPQARLQLVAAPDDAGTTTPLAQQRADRVRRELLLRNVLASQLAPPSATTVAAVQMRMAMAAR